MKQKVYLDTSVISAYFDSRTPERLAQTREFWKKQSSYEFCISDLVLSEMRNVSDKQLKADFLRLIKSYIILKSVKSIKLLAKHYVDAHIIPERYFSDAQHIAIAVHHKIPYIISWNFKHFVNIKTRQKVNLLNLKLQQGLVEIIAPPELS